MMLVKTPTGLLVNINKLILKFIWTIPSKIEKKHKKQGEVTCSLRY